MEQQHFEELSFDANFVAGSTVLGSNAQGGKLIISDETFVFMPHSFNFGDRRDKEFQIKDICGYKKGFLTNFHIYLNNGLDLEFKVWKKDAIINALEERRTAIFRNAGEKVPPLR